MLEIEIEKIINIINFKDYGHADLIDNPYRDIMHFSRLSPGNPNRKQSIYNYHNKLSNIIYNIIYNIIKKNDIIKE